VDFTARVIAAHAENNVTAIVTDHDHNVIRFMVNGVEVARLTGNGLQVRNDIEYGGTITDTGVQAFDQHTGDGSAPN
jgi:hypothetical protein